MLNGAGKVKNSKGRAEMEGQHKLRLRQKARCAIGISGLRFWANRMFVERCNSHEKIEQPTLRRTQEIKPALDKLTTKRKLTEPQGPQ